VNKATIPRSYYLVRNGLNVFTLVENSLYTSIITIPAGNYNYQTFKTTVLNLLNAATYLGYQYTITFDGVAGKFSFTCTGNAAITFPDVIGSSIHEQFGCNDNASYIFPFTSPNVLKFVSEDMVILRSNLANDPTETLAVIIGTGTPDFGTIGYTCRSLRMNTRLMKSNNSNVYSFRLTDPDGNFLDTNGLPLNLELLIYQ
jgi:hypothetical protein